ncbi:MAG TPA: bifunctional UDP-N-acetylglucosamine diphosphorylase/glucosamine-1-phosphate N-acetyltransferase GlmU [Pyrinomonadaceae bacterium]|jgi:bifunctional UDP-N-acetylglucosamine pyrophosphorylase/glucosamine-1-phosphate N-acetyltransferase|nr:bifunctional UDP-N-acetylglucosamine diphosphorylase/glucosamine-1-phosphate N-acetyltransferase GlmU [Pyrinomonadaceae bacterium]
MDTQPPTNPQGTPTPTNATQTGTLALPPNAPLDVLILAAGLGTRMHSRTAKVLHQLGGRPLIAHVCHTAAALVKEGRPVHIVVGHQAEEVKAAVAQELGADGANFIMQTEQRGTGDAVMTARDALADANSTLLVLSGDVPLINHETLGALIHQHRTHRGRGAACTLLTVKLEDPTGYGRIVRDSDGRFERIVEQKDATPEERQIKEINAGIYCFETRVLFPALARVQPANAQGEYYLTDAPGILRADGEDVSIFTHTDAREVSGINTRVELAEFERLLRLRTLRRLMLDSGVTIIDPSHTYVSPEAQIGHDTIIYPSVYIEGRTQIGAACEIRSGTRISNSRIGSGVHIKDHSVIVDSDVADNCSVGPFAHLRMNAQLEEQSAVGNFVEMKKSRLGRRAKAMHLTYLGDASVGDRTNIGAGTITCNYDGKNKHPTVIEQDVKIGSDTMLVAPVKVGARSVTGAGSVVTRDVPPDTLVSGVPATVKKDLRPASPATTGAPEQTEAVTTAVTSDE